MASSVQVQTTNLTTPPRPRFVVLMERSLRRIGPKVLVTGFGIVLLMVFLMPLGYMLTTAFKADSQASSQNAPLWPAKAVTYTYKGEDIPLYNVPTNDGIKQYALVKGLREESTFIDPAHPENGEFQWTGRWRTLNPVYTVALDFENFTGTPDLKGSWDLVRFPLLFRNTFIIATISTLGTLISCILVAYGFARFPVPGKNILFIVLISTIVLPPQATIIPLFILFTKIGWTGTWLPLLVPAFFANAYDVFLLRQYFMSIPKELDEAAMIDGAGPLRTLWSVVIPQAMPAITVVTLFHFFFVWNDYFTPLVYLVGKPDLFPISVGIGALFSTFGSLPGRAMATAVVAIIVPTVMFFFAQRQFMQGIVFTGVDK